MDACCWHLRAYEYVTKSRRQLVTLMHGLERGGVCRTQSSSDEIARRLLTWPVTAAAAAAAALRCRPRRRPSCPLPSQRTLARHRRPQHVLAPSLAGQYFMSTVYGRRARRKRTGLIRFGRPTQTVILISLNLRQLT